MAGDWIKMRVDLGDAREVVLIAQATGLDRPGVIGRLHGVWCWADRETTDGKIRGVTGSFIDELVTTPGFAAAMISAGWLRENEKGITLPNFDHHNGESAKSRALATKRKQRQRSRSRPGHGRSVTQTGPEKRREEKRRKEKTVQSTHNPDPKTSESKHAKRAREAAACDSDASGGSRAAPVRAQSSSSARDACVACPPTSLTDLPREIQSRTMTAIAQVAKSGVSSRRRSQVTKAIIAIAGRGDPMPTVCRVIERSQGKRNPGGYVANALIEEAQT